MANSSTPIPEGIERLSVAEAGPDDLCRFCFAGPDEEEGDLINPCACKACTDAPVHICTAAALQARIVGYMPIFKISRAPTIGPLTATDAGAR